MLYLSKVTVKNECYQKICINSNSFEILSSIEISSSKKKKKFNLPECALINDTLKKPFHGECIASKMESRE